MGALGSSLAQGTTNFPGCTSPAPSCANLSLLFQLVTVLAASCWIFWGDNPILLKTCFPWEHADETRPECQAEVGSCPHPEWL